MNTDEPLPTRASLLNRLKDAGDHTSWEEFHRTYRGLLLGTARRAGLNEHEGEEAVQDTLIAVAKKMPEFRYEAGKDSFKGWLLRIVRWKISDQFRKRRTNAALESFSENTFGTTTYDPQSRGGQISVEETMAGVPDPTQNLDAIWDTEWERHLLALALARVKRQVNPQHYAIYHLHVLEERPLAEVKHALGVGMARVHLAKHRVGAFVARELRRLAKEEW